LANKGEQRRTSANYELQFFVTSTFYFTKLLIYEALGNDNTANTGLPLAKEVWYTYLRDLKFLFY